MTTDNAKKKAVRARMARTGESYTEALRQIEAVAGAAPATSLHFIPDCCANCDTPLSIDNQGLYCSEFCMDLAHFVRYSRRVTRDPLRLSDPGVHEALQIQMAHLMGGGYSGRERHLTSAQRNFILERDAHTCRICGHPGNEVDHISGSSNDESNLQVLCDRCHNDKTKGAMVPANEEQKAWANALWESRVPSDHPGRLSDHEVEWKKRCSALKSQRIHRLWEKLDDETGLTKVDFKGRGLKWSEVLDEAYDEDEMPGERYVEAFEAGDPLPPAALEELEELWYFQDQMAKDD
jgi:hypothetical protein